MENDREVDQVLMNIKGSTGSIVSAYLFSARLTLQLLVFLMRMAKKGLVAAGFADNFKAFTQKTNGNYTVYNIPLSKEKAEKVKLLGELELKLQKANNPLEKVSIRNEIKRLQNEIPELEQLKKLGINHCVLPKLNGSVQTIQVAIDRKDDQLFKSWFIDHLTTGLSGGEKGMEDLKVFTEGNYSIFNMPFEGTELRNALSDFETLNMNYSILPDLKVGDGYTQLAIPNADRSKLETWFSMWKKKLLNEGKDPGEMYAMDQQSYMNMSSVDAKEYIANSEPQYQEANAEYEAKAISVPWSASLQKENSEEYVRLLQDKNYEKITINEETLVNNMLISGKAAKMRKNGYFISRVPGTYGEQQQILVLPKEQVFRTDEGKTYVAFLPKNGKTLIADSKGNVAEHDFASAYAPYKAVKRSLSKVENLKKGISPTKNAVLNKATAKKTAPKVTVPKL